MTCAEMQKVADEKLEKILGSLEEPLTTEKIDAAMKAAGIDWIAHRTFEVGDPEDMIIMSKDCIVGYRAHIENPGGYYYLPVERNDLSCVHELDENKFCIKCSRALWN